MENITKKILVAEIAKTSKVPQATVKLVLEIFVSELTGHLVKGDHVNVDGFGTFTVVERAARTGRNPHTGEPLEIPARKAPDFKFGKNIKDAVKNIK